MPDEAPKKVAFRLEVPDSLRSGVYANFCSVWNGEHDFTLDFAVLGRPESTEAGVAVPSHVVARIKIPLALAPELLRALATQISQLEEFTGQTIPRFVENTPLFPPEDMR